MLWCIAQQGQRDGSLKDMMQAMFWADFNHDDPKLTLVIVDAYPQGTRPQIGMITKFAIPPNKIVQQQVAAIVVPIIATKGKPCVGSRNSEPLIPEILSRSALDGETSSKFR
jgi:hypothetical protein